MNPKSYISMNITNAKKHKNSIQKEEHTPKAHLE